VTSAGRAGLLLLAGLLLAGCVRDNRARIERLENASARLPRPELDRHLETLGWAVPLREGAGPVVLAMEGGHTPVVRVRIDGVEMPALVDTGASLLALSGPAAEAVSLYVPRRQALAAHSPGYDPTYRVGAFSELVIGGLRFGPGAAVVPERESRWRAPAGLAEGCYGIVGCPVLGHGVVVFDFAARHVELRPVAGARPGGVLFVTARLAGREYSLLVDSGASRVWLEPWAARELELIDDAQVARLSDKGDAFGRGPNETLRLDAIEVAGRRFEHVPGGVVHTFPEGAGHGPNGERPAGLLGLAAFGERIWTVDFPRRRLRVVDPPGGGE